MAGPIAPEIDAHNQIQRYIRHMRRFGVQAVIDEGREALTGEQENETEGGHGT
jgi:hypothetical protein